MEPCATVCVLFHLIQVNAMQHADKSRMKSRLEGRLRTLGPVCWTRPRNLLHRFARSAFFWIKVRISSSVTYPSCSVCLTLCKVHKRVTECSGSRGECGSAVCGWCFMEVVMLCRGKWSFASANMSTSSFIHLVDFSFDWRVSNTEFVLMTIQYFHILELNEDEFRQLKREGNDDGQNNESGIYFNSVCLGVDKCRSKRRRREGSL